MGLVRVRLAARVVACVKTLPPETRRKIDAELSRLEKGDGDIVALEAELSGFSRLRVGCYRIIYGTPLLPPARKLFVSLRSGAVWFTKCSPSSPKRVNSERS